MDIHLQQLQDLKKNRNLTQYLASANFQIIHADVRQPIRARIAQFKDMTFAHTAVPPVEVLWQRDYLSNDRALLLMARKGSITIEGKGKTISRGEQAHLVLPGVNPITIHAHQLGTELTYMSIPDTLLTGIGMPDKSEDHGEILFSTIAPAYFFTTSLCAMSIQEVKDPAPLRSAASEIVRSTLRMVFGTKGTVERSRFGAAMEIILRDYASPSLNTEEVAQQVGVSPRVLQLEFKKQGTTFSKELRKIRTAAAAKLKGERPDITLQAIADQTGFGSLASIRRALQSGP